MKTTYNKLIRDRIPEIIQADGKQYSVEEVGDQEYKQALLDKLLEEAEEVHQAPSEKIALEIAQEKVGWQRRRALKDRPTPAER